ncbi:hypothetical protein BOX15_Mlig014592g1, partial [Macrostomum lignano]
LVSCPNSGMSAGLEQTANKSADALLLCIDIGTTAVKLLLVESATRRILYSGSCNIEASPVSTAPRQSVMSLHSILAAFSNLASKIDSHIDGDDNMLGRVSDILLCGQMHGIAMWRSEQPLASCSELVTWQDGRCSLEFLQSLPAPSRPEVVAPKSGFGLATLLWWQRHQPDRLAEFDACGSAMDWLAALLIGGSGSVRMSGQLAASWGYFDLAGQRWDADSLAAAGLPPRPRLPDIAPVGHVVGCLSPTLLTSLASGHAWAGRLPSSCRVRVPLGDLQCVVYSVYAPLQPSTLSSTSTGPADFDGRAFLNFGTSAQLGFLTSEPPQQPSVRDHAGIDCFPFFSPDRYVLLAASLNGGNVLAEFVQTLADWQEQLTGQRCPSETVWQRLQVLADEAKPASASDPDPLISPTLLDERCGGGTQGGSVLGLRMSSCRSLGRLYRSVCLGLINNLLSLCPPAALRQAGIDRIILAGSALRRNAVLRRAAALRFDECQFQSIVLEDGGARQQPAVADGAAGLAAQFLDWVAAGRGES